MVKENPIIIFLVALILILVMLFTTVFQLGKILKNRNDLKEQESINTTNSVEVENKVDEK